MNNLPEQKSQFRLVVETALITIIALSAWIGFVYFIYLTE